ncbi:MAG TPA: hypothetical protein VF658_21900 [Pyrinomonadaceae bacterium]|jgi:hypothetical protein
MNDFLIDLGLSTLFTLLRNINATGQQSTYRKALLKLYRAIQTAYADDPEFQTPTA